MTLHKPVPTGEMMKRAKQFGGRKEFARRFANFKNPFDYYLWQKKRSMKIPEQAPFVPIEQRKVKVVKNALNG